MHHEMAIDMSERFLAADFAKHPEAEALAREIIAAQSAEVGQLQGWLATCTASRSMKGTR